MRKIEIIKNGPYRVLGAVPLKEKRIVCKEGLVEFETGQNFEIQEEYFLCRCGNSKTAPFCDGTHEDIEFDGDETASQKRYIERARLIKGEVISLQDDGRCAFARFCHKKHGTVWDLMSESGEDETLRKEVLEGASECPAGRLTVLSSVDHKTFEYHYAPEINVIQDIEKGCSGGLFVKGNISLSSADKEEYEVRNRITLCRCGESENKPFCDGSHVSVEFDDQEKK